jgi:hypothetical protein
MGWELALRWVEPIGKFLGRTRAGRLLLPAFPFVVLLAIILSGWWAELPTAVIIVLSLFGVVAIAVLWRIAHAQIVGSQVLTDEQQETAALLGSWLIRKDNEIAQWHFLPTGDAVTQILPGAQLLAARWRFADRFYVEVADAATGARLAALSRPITGGKVRGHDSNSQRCFDAFKLVCSPPWGPAQGSGADRHLS